MAKKKRTKRMSPGDWENLPDDEILQIRVGRLGLQIPNSPIKEYVQRLYDELNSRGVNFRPPCYLADEWLCPDKVPIIGIPFCLAHPRLKHIELKMMLEVEGGTPETFMKLLRHETGHAINYAYQLYKTSRWRELFGRFTDRYSMSYACKPYSKRHVRHLEDNYAQAHPDEDFAETFAVWLTPNNNWEQKYKDWPVIKKLRYVDRMMQKIGDRPPLCSDRITPWSAARMTSTLEAHYERKRSYLGDDFPGYYDDSLKKLFREANDSHSGQKASRFLRAHKRIIVNNIAGFTRQRKYDIHQLIGKLTRRCNALDLYTSAEELETTTAVTAFVTAVAGKVFRGGQRHQSK